VHDLRERPVAVGSPQTQSQRDQVKRVITKLMAEATNAKRAQSLPVKPFFSAFSPAQPPQPAVLPSPPSAASSDASGVSKDSSTPMAIDLGDEGQVEEGTVSKRPGNVGVPHVLSSVP
jgi:hypothetical protein